MKIITVANQKGGVGKTTTALSIGAALAYQEKRVLLMDLDIQCNLTVATIGPIVGPGSHEASGDVVQGMAEVLLEDAPLISIIRETCSYQK